MKKIAFAAVIFVILASVVSGYDNIIIHPKLARQATVVYNLQAEKKLSISQIDWIVAGSIKEDADPRYLHHFYKFDTGNGYKIWSSAAEWTQVQDSALGDFSESAILNAYKQGNEQLAYIGVGHQLHLIEDMAVPAHVMAVGHNPDFYENWCQQNNKNIIDGKIQTIDSLKDAVLELSNFTGTNFYTRDVMDGKIRFEKTIVENGRKYAIRNGYKLAVVNDTVNGYELELDNNVNEDYLNQLAPKAIGYSAGVIDYFQRKFAVIDEERKNENKIVAFFKSLVNFLPDSKSDSAIAWGDTVNMSNITAQLALNDSLRAQVMNDAVLRNDLNNSMLASDPTSDMANVKVVNAVKKGVQKTKVLGEKITSKIIASTTENKLTTNITTPETSFDIGLGGEGETVKSKTTFKIINPANAEELVDLSEQAPLPKFPFTFSSGGSTLVEKSADIEPMKIPDPIIFPETIIVSNPPLLSSSSSVFFLFSSDQASSTYQYLFDTAGTSSEWLVASNESGMSSESLVTSTSRLATSVNDGIHTLSVRAVYNGVADQTPAEYTWSVDTTPPTSIISALVPYHNQPTFTVNWGRSDLVNDNASYDIECRINDNDWLPYLTGTTSTSSVFAQGVQAGDYVHFRIRACDELGNCEAWPSVEQASTRVGPVTPGSVTLTSDSVTQNSAKINWQAPLDGYLSAEAKYDLRYQKKIGVCNLNTNWETASSASNLPAVAETGGEVVTLTMENFEPGTTYCTALRTFNGFNWSTTSNTLEIKTDCPTPANLLANYNYNFGVANNWFGPTELVEPILIVKTYGQQSSFRTYVGSVCGMYNSPAFGVSSVASQQAVEYAYDSVTKKLTGKYRMCDNAPSNYAPRLDANGQCNDKPTWWGGGRWMYSSGLVGQSVIAIYADKSSAMTDWLKIQ